MSTSEEIIESRAVSVLLNILETDKTFAGMTDAEIQSIITYKEQLAYSKGRTDESADLQEAYRTNMHRQMQTSLQTETDLLQSIIDRASNPVLKVVQYG